MVDIEMPMEVMGEGVAEALAQASARPSNLPKSSYRNLPHGEVRINGDGPTLRLGEHVDAGATTSVISEGESGTRVYRIMRRGFNEWQLMVDEFGTEVIIRLERGSNGIY